MSIKPFSTSKMTLAGGVVISSGNYLIDESVFNLLLFDSLYSTSATGVP